MNKMFLNVANFFSVTPGPALKSEGKYSGEEFRESLLLPMLIDSIGKDCKLVVDLDGTAGYGLCFLSQAFGKLVEYMDIEFINNYLDFISEDEPHLITDIKISISERAHS